MHFHLPLILAIAATTLALPTTDQTTSNLEKRDHHGWIGTFNDSQCTGTTYGPRPELHLGDCTAFTSDDKIIGYVGIYFGSGVYSFNHLGTWSDGGCSNVWDDDDPAWNLQKKDYTETDLACIDLSEAGWQANSVKPYYRGSS